MHRSSLPLLASLALTGTLSAQTSTHTTTAAHRTTGTAAHRATAAKPGAPACATLPADLSPKIPTLPAGTPCAKAMVTISEGIQFSPLVGPELRKNFGDLPMSFTLAFVDTQVGTGELAQPHMFYTVKYTGYLPDGTKFDSSYDHDETKGGLPFPYGAHRVIPGWDMGFEGMHVGGKRRLYIPYQLAYGDRGHPPVIPPKSELIFDMELVSQSATDPTPRPTPPVAPVTPSPATPATPGTPSPGAQPSSPAPSAPAPGTSTPPASAPGEKPVPAKPGTTPPTTAPSPSPSPSPSSQR